MEKRFQKIYYIGFFILVFAFLFLWFSQMHPLVPFDADDWTYLSYARLATPNPAEWNPAKVFPEILYPFFSSIAAFAVMPLTHDYVNAQTIVHAFVVSAFITGYLISFACLIRRLFSLSRINTAMLTVIFLALHFWVLRSSLDRNIYLLASNSINCYYNYQLPVLLNASIVMCLMANPGFEHFLHNGRLELRGLALVILYLAIFSNLPACGLLAAYAGSQLLLALIRTGRHFRIQSFIRTNWFSLCILAAWFVCAGFELFGARASSALAELSLSQQLRMTCYYLKETLFYCNRAFQVCAIVLVILTLVSLRKNGLTAIVSHVVISGFIAGGAFGIYTILLCSMVAPSYITSSHYLLSLFFYVLLLLMLGLAYLLEKHAKLALILPLLTIFMISSVNTSGRTFVDIDPEVDLTSEQCAALSRYVIDQYQQAYAMDLEEFTLYVPQFPAYAQTGDNWPFSLPLLERISDTLFAHRLIGRPMGITPVIDPSLNPQFQLPSP